MNELYTMEELIPIVSCLAEKFTRDESSSITYDRAKQLMEAVIYCIRIYTIDSMVSQVEQHMDKETYGLRLGPKKLEPKDAYRKGICIIEMKIKKVFSDYEELLKDFNSYGNQCYEDTVIKGLPIFFQKYDSQFDPQNHLLTLDYPAIDRNYDLVGISAIEDYMSALIIENNFLKVLPNTYVEDILCSYHKEVKELVINIPSLVIPNLLGNIILSRGIYTIGYSSKDLNKLQKELGNLGEIELQQYLETLLSQLIQVMNLTHSIDYLDLCISDLVTNIQQGLRFNHLDKVFFS